MKNSDDIINNKNFRLIGTGSESYTGTEARSLLREEAGNRLTEKL